MLIYLAQIGGSDVYGLLAAYVERLMLESYVFIKRVNT